MSCTKVIDGLVSSINEVNTEITKNMIDTNTKYDDVCIKPNLTFDFYHKSLKNKWEKIINDFINNPEKCSGNIQNILFVYEVASKLKSTDNFNPSNPQNLIDKLGRITPKQIETAAYDKMVDVALKMINSDSETTFVMDVDMKKTLKNLALTLGDRCQCQMIDIFTFIMEKYKKKYSKKLAGKTHDESVKILKHDYEYVKNIISSYGKDFGNKSNNETNSFNVTSVLDFSIDDELNRLIPDELGTMKQFFIKVISKYFNNLHPIIWAQIFRGMMSNLFIDLPMTPPELFSFASKYLLLNSGPFILKLLQMIRPVLSDELAAKYNLTKLSYPLLEPEQIDMILKHIVIDYDMLKVTYNKSASVGHVCICHNVKNPNDKFVIKIVKPLAIAQSCWEYYILKDLFPNGSCEDSFIKNTLRSNGSEMNVVNEIANLDRGFANYSTNYKTEFGIDIDVKLTTIAHRKGIIKEGTWFALATTLAPGIPLADLIEAKMLENDTKFRATLHRCLDLLVTKFFYVLISQGFYHGDLHSGNVFFSFKRKQLTMIDFGAMGDIELFSNDDTTAKLLMIIIMSVYYDYDGMLDVLTDILNDRCKDDEQSSFIDKESESYKEFKTVLIKHKIKNTLNAQKEKENATKYLEDVSSKKRLDDERVSADKNTDDTLHMVKDSQKEDRDPSIYDNLDLILESKEIVVENKDVLPVFTEELGESESISFAGIMQLVIKFYATSGVNVAIKFAELNELQKAYALLLGVLAKTGYNSYRMSMAIKTGVLTWGHLPKLLNIGTTSNVLSSYWNESSEYNTLKTFIDTEKSKWVPNRNRSIFKSRIN
jgi:hypothetical protein